MAGADAMPGTVRVVEDAWIPLADATRLHARLWLPGDATAGPAPAILEAGPYRLTDQEAQRDWGLYGWWAAHGYACVRVDLRGTGDSGGVILDEYTAQEQADILEVLGWIAAQPWCDGGVGLVGLSWTGFNALQVAALRPPELRAVLALMFSDDRYEDDVHYRGGCVAGLEMLAWGGVMYHYNALPAHPQVTGAEDWRSDWRARLEANANWTETWLSHQCRDGYWRRASVNECYSRVEVPVYAVGGWQDSDGYVDAVFRLMDGLRGPRRGLIGPWGHAFPHEGVPGPAIGFMHEALRWWDHWLKGIDSGLMDEPMLRVWMEDHVPPARVIESQPGRWVAEPVWPPADAEWRTWWLGDGALVDGPGREHSVELHGSRVTGADCGENCAGGSPGDWPGDQRDDDARSLTWDSPPLDAPLEILGRPEVSAGLSADRENALLAVRLEDVAPDGSSLLVTRGVLNLTHRCGHASPEPLIPGEHFAVTVHLRAAAHAFAIGHRLRVAVSADYWPWVWPSPEPVVLTVFEGQEGRLTLPVRRPRAIDAHLPAFEDPEATARLACETLEEAGSGGRRTAVDADAGTSMVEVRWWDGGRYRYPRWDITTEDSVRVEGSITRDDPLTARVRFAARSDLVRGGELDVRVETDCEMSCDRETFFLTSRQRVLEHGRESWSGTRQKAIPRDLV
jgi:putative CocE/NonD family hydrolase